MLALWGICLALTVLIYASIMAEFNPNVSLTLSYILMLAFGVTALYTFLHV